MRESDSDFHLDRKAAGYFTAVILLVALGPFGTYVELHPWERLSYWAVMLLAVGLIIEASFYVCLNTITLQWLPPPGRLVIGALMGSVPATPVVVFIDRVFRTSTLEPGDFPSLYPKILLIALVVGFVDRYLWAPVFRSLRPDWDDVRKDEEDLTETETKETESTAEAAGVPLLSHLSRPLQAEDIISLTVQDHYVEVTTIQGTEMILMRLADAIELANGVPGFRIHRSHWVARAHVRGLVREGRRTFVELSDGRRLPVSATYLGSVRDTLGETA